MAGTGVISHLLDLRPLDLDGDHARVNVRVRATPPFPVVVIVHVRRHDLETKRPDPEGWDSLPAMPEVCPAR